MFRADLGGGAGDRASARGETDQPGAAPQPVEPRLRAQPSSTWGSAASAARNGHGATEPRPAVTACCTVGPAGGDLRWGLALPHDGVERPPAPVRPLQRARQRLLRPYDSRPQATRTFAAGSVALGLAPHGAPWPHLPPVVAPAQISRNTKPRTSQCSSRFSMNTTGWPLPTVCGR